MCKNWIVLTLILLVLFCGLSSVSAATPAKIVGGVVTNLVSALVKWLWSLKSAATTTATTKTGGRVESSRSMVKFEGGYSVETVFDGSKLGIEPYSVELSPNGELLVLDSQNSNIYKISTPLSPYSRPKLVAGSPEGYSGHVDGKLREARMNNPKGLTVDDRGNIYIADTVNMAIRKITDSGVTTIAGGKRSRGGGGGHIDGPSEDAKFSNDFDVVYIGSSCSLLVVDRGNEAIREIQLQPDDCSYHEQDSSFHLGIAVLVAAAFFGYMLALLQHRVQSLFSSSNKDSRTPMRRGVSMAPYQRPQKSVRPPIIPQEDEPEKADEGGFSGSIGRLVSGGLFSGFRKKSPAAYQYHDPNMYPNPNAWPMQETYVIPHEDEPPSIDARTPAPKQTYPMMTQDVVEKNYYQHHHIKHSRPYHSGRDDGDYQQQSKRQMQDHRRQQQQHHEHYFSNPKTYYEKSCETNEIVFGAVQEQDGCREAVVIKAVDYADPRYNHHNVRPRINYVGYSHGY